jgi:CheY-like chemotaxis protein
MTGEILALDKVLHAENEELQRILMRRWFKDWGGPDQRGWFETSTFSGAVEIIQREANNFQMIILDLNLDDSWGIVTAERLRPLTASPFVVCTSGDIEEVKPRMKELGIYGIIDKGKSFTMDRIKPIVLAAYTTWRDERIVQSLSNLNAKIKAVTERRERWLAQHEHRV